MRLDALLAGRGFYKSRSKASEAIKNGLVKIDGATVRRPSFEVTGDEDIEAAAVGSFVSRAGEKLCAALSAFGTDVSGMTALDIGASTGGFTDCLLQRGARFVYALDVGRNQLDEKLLKDERVQCIEGYNARFAKKDDFDREIDVITMDVSFISQALIYPACAEILAPGKPMITLIKPQFEAGRSEVGKGGIVRDRGGRIIKEITARLDCAANENGFERRGMIESPITGGDGNTEYLALFIKTGV